MTEANEGNYIYLLDIDDSYIPLNEKMGHKSQKERESVINVAQAVIKDSLTETLSSIITSLEEVAKANEKTYYEVSEMSFQLAISAEGKVAVPLLNVVASGNTSGLFDVKIKKKDN